MNEKKPAGMFSKDNYRWMLIGLLVVVIGMILLSGGKSNNDPAVFDRAAVYSPIRVTVAPLLILLGLGIEVFAIFKKPRAAAS